LEKETIIRSPTFEWGGFSWPKSLRQDFFSIFLNMFEILAFLLCWKCSELLQVLYYINKCFGSLLCSTEQI
jgi:hypothetical protein